MRISKKTVIIVVSVAAAVVTVSFFATRKPKIAYETEKVDRGTVIEEISVTGSLSPTSKISLQPEASGRVSAVHVEKGDDVKNGQLLIEIDARDLNARIASQRAAVDSAKARLAELVAGATPQELAQAQAAVDAAESKRDAAIAAKADAGTALSNAGKNYDSVIAKAATLLESKRTTAILGYEEAVTVANDAVSRLTSPMFTSDDFLTFTTTNSQAENDARATRKDAKAMLPLLESAVASAKTAGTVEATIAAQAGIVSYVATIKVHLEADAEVLKYALNMDATTKATYQQNVNSGLSASNASLQRLSTDKANIELQQNMNATDIGSAQTALSNAQASLTSATFAITSAERALAQVESDLSLKKSGNRTEVIAAQRARVAADEATLSGLYADLAKRRIVSPLAGIVTDVTVNKGETVQPSQVAVTVQAKGNFEITTNVSEIDVGKLKVGQPVRITLDAFPRSEEWTGKVVSIDPAEKVLEGIIFYETTVIFDVEDPRVRSGMTANLVIETERKDGVLRVPLRALKDSADKTTVRVMRGGVPVETEITIGLENNTHAEVLSGLAEGDEVVIAEIEKK